MKFEPQLRVLSPHKSFEAEFRFFDFFQSFAKEVPEFRNAYEILTTIANGCTILIVLIFFKLLRKKFQNLATFMKTLTTVAYI